MGRLINPKLGDYIDRYTILALKRQHTDGPVEESEAIESDAIELAVPWIDMRLDLVMKIAMINTLLWVATDELDAAIAVNFVGLETRSIHHGKKMRRLNRQRAELVAELSGLDEAQKEAMEETDDV